MIDLSFLKDLPKEYKVIENVIIPSSNKEGGKAFDFPAIIVSPYGIYLIAYYEWKGKIQNTESAKWLLNDKKITNPMNFCDAASYNIRNLLWEKFHKDSVVTVYIYMPNITSIDFQNLQIVLSPNELKEAIKEEDFTRFDEVEVEMLFNFFKRFKENSISNSDQLKNKEKSLKAQATSDKINKSQKLKKTSSNNKQSQSANLASKPKKVSNKQKERSSSIKPNKKQTPQNKQKKNNSKQANKTSEQNKRTKQAKDLNEGEARQKEIAKQNPPTQKNKNSQNIFHKSIDNGITIGLYRPYEPYEEGIKRVGQDDENPQQKNILAGLIAIFFLVLFVYFGING